MYYKVTGPQQGNVPGVYQIRATRIAWVNLSLGLTEEAMKYYLESIELETIGASKEDKEWPSNEISFSASFDLARAY